MSSLNILMVQMIAEGLGELNELMVFVGGAVTELYASDSAFSEIRPTQDVDCVVQVSSRLEYSKLETLLRFKGFANDTSFEAPICRWIFKDIKVDIMPVDEHILGFSNKWYIEGIKNRIKKEVENRFSIYIFPVEYYLASKFEAHNSRGGNDLRQSHDFEDIIFIFDNCTTLFEDINKSDARVKKYLSYQCGILLDNKNLLEGIECSLPFGETDDRAETIIYIIRQLFAL